MPINSLWEMQAKETDIPWEKDNVIKFFVFSEGYSHLGFNKCLLSDLVIEEV